MNAEGSTGASLREIMDGLHKVCGETLVASFDQKFDTTNGGSYGFSSDMDQWRRCLKGRPENDLYQTASREFAIALLNNFHGQYRNGFKGLRLVLELILEGVYLSANLVALSEWLSNQRDTIWAAVIDRENGVLSKPFCRAFYPELAGQAIQLNTIAATLYRELSECTHGNVPNKIPLPDQLTFHEETFLLWHEKAKTVRYVATFTLTMRYFNELGASAVDLVKPLILEQMGHIEPVRVSLGGPASND
jgi:hypothetical protein